MRHAALLLLGSTAALAQPSSLRELDLLRGLTLPPTSAALADEATAPGVNPAGLLQLRALQIFYAHERTGANRDFETANGLYLGDTFLGALGLGASVEWINNHQGPEFEQFDIPSRRKTTWSVALGSSALSIGAGFSFFASDEHRGLDEATSVDLGLLARPTRALSFGATLQNVGATRIEAAPFRQEPFGRRRYGLALGVRPFGDRITAGVDYRLDDASGLAGGDLSWVLRVEPVRGLEISGGLTHGGGRADGASFPNAYQLGVTWNAPHTGASYALGSSAGGLDHVVLARLSAAAYTPEGRHGGGMALLDLAEELSRGGSTSLALLGVGKTDAWLRLTRLLVRAERDPALTGVVVKIEALPEVGLGRAEELRRSLLRLRAAGKKVVAVMLGGGDAEYLVATGAERIYLAPQSMLLVNGLSASVTFLGGTMEKLGVSWDVARVGAYKNAPDALTRTEMSREQRETIDAYLDDEIRHLVSAIAQARGLTEDQVTSAMAEGIVTPRRAVELKLADEVVDPSALDEKLGARLGGRYSPPLRERRTWGPLRKVALVPVVGTIASGESREDPLGFAEIAGAQTVVEAIEEAKEDGSVAAIVLRIDSGGGDALASDLMYRAVLEAKKEKPVFASMGDVAASGGYYAAMGANRVFAAPTSLTGSIGVFVMKPALGGLAEKLGARNETVKRGELSTMFGTYHPWSAAERAAAQKWVDAFYDDFIGEVAASRKLDKAKVDALARGRVWSGAAARGHGLVDELGTLQDAIDAARKEAGIPDGEPYELEIVGEPSGLASAIGETPFAGALARTPALPPALRAIVEELGVPPAVLLEAGARALMPFRLTVR